jgi:rhamnogalacturonyl hydrolase YesR
VLNSSKNQDYKGYNKHDGLLSPVLSALMNHNKLLRLIAIQTVMRFPFNIRPLLLVPRTRNPKGIGLFAYAYLNSYQLTNKAEFFEEAERLLTWLEENASQNFGGISWGYQYPWQDVGFFAPSRFPNRVITCWIGFSFFKAWHITKNSRYLDICKKICMFLRDAPNKIVDTDDELCLSYVSDKSVTWAVMDVSALAGKMFALTGTATDDASLLKEARRCIQYIINRQTDYGAWFYTDPPKESHITHDNYHTGIILDCIHDYMKVIKSDEFIDSYKNGLEYYAEHLFLNNGAPKWMNNRVFPLDIHGAAQGIISFTKASERYTEYLKKAELILEWTIKNMYNKKTGTFYYQKGLVFTKRFTLLRWCNGWMSYALSSYLLRIENNGRT